MTFTEIITEAKRLDAESSKEFRDVEDHKWADFCRSHLADLISYIERMTADAKLLNELDKFAQTRGAFTRLFISNSQDMGYTKGYVSVWISDADSGKGNNIREALTNALAASRATEGQG